MKIFGPRMMPRGKRRYFTESSTETDSRNAVGCLSPTLRRAFNLKDSMLPIWIYRMRILGYPPAWMREAESSTLSVFDDQGPSCTTTPSKTSTLPRIAGLEEGELSDRQRYYKSSLFEYPGFNAPVPENVNDDWLILGMPPYQQEQQLSEAVKSMNFVEPVPYKRPRIDKEPDLSQSTSLDDQQPPACSKPDSTPLNECDRTPSCTPGPVISVGPPVPLNPKSRLPPLDKWAVGMGELLHFENLANSTGAYQRMRDTLNKIRGSDRK